MANIQRVASIFFRAIDEKQSTPYVFHGDRKPTSESHETDYTAKEPDDPPSDDSDQEELDRFIAEIEDAADHEWAEEEAAEREEASRIRYWKREEVGMNRSSEDVRGRERGQSMDGNQRATNIRKWDSNDNISEESEQKLDSSYEMCVSPGIHDEYFEDDDNNRGVEKQYSKMRTGGSRLGSTMARVYFLLVQPWVIDEKERRLEGVLLCCFVVKAQWARLGSIGCRLGRSLWGALLGSAQSSCASYVCSLQLEAMGADNVFVCCNYWGQGDVEASFRRMMARLCSSIRSGHCL